MYSYDETKEKLKNFGKAWDAAYKENSPENLGWYEEISEPSLTLIKKYLKEREKTVLDAGCGESTLIQSLLDNGYRNLIGIDISYQAIKFLNENIRLPKESTLELRRENLTDQLNFKSRVDCGMIGLCFIFYRRERNSNGIKKIFSTF